MAFPGVQIGAGRRRRDRCAAGDARALGGRAAKGYRSGPRGLGPAPETEEPTRRARRTDDRDRPDQPDRRRHRRQSRAGPGLPPPGGGGRGRPRGVLPSWCWSAIRRRTWCSSRRSRTRRALRPGAWPRTPPTAGRPCSSARPGSTRASSTTPRFLLQGGARRRPGATSTICRTTACSTRSGCSRRARCRGRCAFPLRGGEPSGWASWSARTCGPRTWPRRLAESGAEILVVPNGSPFEHGKQDERLQLAVARVTETGLPLIYVNQVGGQDELVFDGASFALDADRRLVAQAPSFVEDAGADRAGERRRDEAWRRSARGAIAPPLAGARGDLPRHGAWACATMSTRTASRAWCWACRAASIRRSRPRSRSTRSGPERVHAVMMPSRYTSPRQPGGRRRLRRGCWASGSTRCRSSRAVEAFRQHAGAAVRRPARRTRPRRTSSRASAA